MTDQDKVDTCYAIKDNQEALRCIKNFVGTAGGSCLPKLVLLTQERCVPCGEEKALHQQAINEGIIQLIDIDTPEGLAIAKLNDIDAVPVLLLLDCHDKVMLPSD